MENELLELAKLKGEVGLSRSPLVAKLSRRNTGNPAEGAGKVCGIRVARRERDLDDLEIRVSQQLAGVLKSDGVEQV